MLFSSACQQPSEQLKGKSFSRYKDFKRRCNPKEPGSWMTGPLPPPNLKLNPSWVQSLTRVRFQNGNELMKCSYIYGLGKWLENRLNSISQSIEFVRSWNLSSVPPNASLRVTVQRNPHLWAWCGLGVILVAFSVLILQWQLIQRTNLLLNYSLSGSATSQEAGLWRGRREKTGN